MIKTEILKLSADNQDKPLLQRAAEIINRGGVIAFPTETVYALGADVMNEQAVQRVFHLKKRMSGKPIATFLPKLQDLKRFVKEITPSASKLIKEFWPGPLTLIFKSESSQMTYLTGTEGKLGVRVSSSKFVQSLLTETRTPLTATSANLSGKPEPATAEQVLSYFDGKINLVINGGHSYSAIPSSVVDVSEEIPILLREGRIPYKKLKKVVPELKRKNKK
jgi:L-threonylcarbamoyladenylate synthase